MNHMVLKQNFSTSQYLVSVVRAFWLADNWDTQCATGWSHLVRDYAKIERHIVKELIWQGAEPTRSAEHAVRDVAEVKNHNYFHRYWNNSTESLEHTTLAEEHVSSTKSECSIRVNCSWRGIMLASPKYSTLLPSIIQSLATWQVIIYSFSLNNIFFVM